MRFRTFKNCLCTASEKKKKLGDPLALASALGNFLVLYATSTPPWAGMQITAYTHMGTIQGIALAPFVAGAVVAVLFVKVGLDGYCQCKETIGGKIWRFLFGVGE